MKKVLLATTALALTAGMAAAEVSLSDYAEIGIASADDGTNETTTFHSDIDVTFTLSGETDGGLSFGATIDLDEVGDDADPTGDSIASSNPDGSAVEEQSVFVSGDFGTLTIGDTDGAFDWAMTEVFWGTTLTDDHSTHPGANGNAGLDGSLNGQVARYDYAFGDFAVAISAEIASTDGREDNLGIGVKYSTSFGGVDLGFGLGYQKGYYQFAAGGVDFSGDGADADILGASVSAAFAGGFQARLNYSTLDGSGSTGADTDVEWDHMAIGLGYSAGPLLVEANYGEYDGTGSAAGAFDADGFGLSVNYDLGGGAVVMVGYGAGENFAGTDVSTWSAGLGLSF